MDVHFTALEPEKIKFTISITMNLAEWNLLSKTLSTSWPSWELGDAIASVVRQAHQAFVPKEQDVSRHE